MRPLYTLPLPDVVIDALTNAGFQYIQDLKPDLKNYDETATSIITSFGLEWKDIEKHLESSGCISAAQLLRNEQLNEYIPTFCQELDGILDGGVQTDSILQICGPPGSGKTQLCLQLCVTVQIPVPFGGLGAECVFIDTEGTFSPKRLRDLAIAATKHCSRIAPVLNIPVDRTFDENFILSRVHYTRVTHLVHLLSSINKLKRFLQENRNIKLVIIDSITFPFLNMKSTLERTHYINTICQDLLELASNHNISVVLSNHVTTKITEESKTLVPSLGESFSHFTPNILLLGKTSDFFSAAIYKSNKLKEGVINFKITVDGVRDIELK